MLTRYGQRLINCTICWRRSSRKRLMSSAMTTPAAGQPAGGHPRFSLQTSARNSGSAPYRPRRRVRQHVEVLLADGQTRLNVAITAQTLKAGAR